jgi:hypothetical protein
MWRRIPILPMLFGVFAAWALLGMLASGKEQLSDVRVFAVAALLGALFAVLARAILRGPVRSRSKFGWLRLGCAYAWLGIGFIGFVIAPLGLMKHTDIAMRDWPGILSLVAFGGLGILGGLMTIEFRRGESDRQQLALARDLQQRLLPPPLLESDGFRITARNMAAAYVAGDFYDFVPLPEGVLIVIADVAGKGMAAGLIMASVKAMLPLLAAENPDPANVLCRLNERLALRASRRDFVALIAAKFEPRSGRLSVANAGLPDPLIVAADGAAPRAIVVSGPRYPAGIRSPLAYEATSVTLGAGDRVIFFTDGLPEAGLAGGQLGYERFTAEVQRSRGELSSLFDRLERAGAAHDDDWTAVVLERLG